MSMTDPTHKNSTAYVVLFGCNIVPWMQKFGSSIVVSALLYKILWLQNLPNVQILFYIVNFFYTNSTGFSEQ